MNFRPRILLLCCSIALSLQLFVRSSCAEESPTNIRSRLATLDGDYSWNSAAERWDFSRRRLLEEIVTTYGPKQAVPELISCLDDTTEARTKVYGKRVLLGVVCSEALAVTAYFESSGRDGDLVPASIRASPLATRSELEYLKWRWEKALFKGFVIYY